MYFVRKLQFLFQSRGVFCEVRNECHVDLLAFKALMSVATILTKHIVWVFDCSIS